MTGPDEGVPEQAAHRPAATPGEDASEQAVAEDAVAEDAVAEQAVAEEAVAEQAGPPPAATPDQQPPLRMLLEAVLLVTDEPVPAVTLAQVTERPTGQVERELTALADEYAAQGRGFDLRSVAGGWRLYTRSECAPWVERFVLDGQQARLTQAALETLAVIAYRQPVTRARVSAVRGVNVDGVVRTLVARGLVTEAGQDGDTGGTLYVTTGLLLEKLGLTDIGELPSLAPLLPELSDLEDGSMSA